MICLPVVGQVCWIELPGVLVAVWVVLQYILQEALQQAHFGSAAAGGGGGAGASGGGMDGVQVFEAGQVLRDEM